MCSVAGYVLGDYTYAREAFKFFEQIFIQSQIRGLHSTGVAWMEQRRFYAMKILGSAKELVETTLWGKLQRSVPESMLVHCRYSTSGVVSEENAQPIVGLDFAIAHNGLVSMESPAKLNRDYKVKLSTTNDSEVILQKMFSNDYLAHTTAQRIADAIVQIAKVEPPIYSLGVLERETGDLYVTRDHLRPLCIFYVKQWGMTGFASTKDIVLRAAKKAGVEVQTSKIPPYTIFRLSTMGVAREYAYAEYFVNVQHTKEKPYPTPALPRKSWLRNAEINPYAIPCALDEPDPLIAPNDHRDFPRNSFKTYAAAATATWEIDPNYPMLAYLFQRYDLSLSQQLWWCWLYGVFYHPGSVFFVAQEFPEYEKVDIERLRWWHEKNWKMLRYNKDRKYEKGHFVAMFESYRQLIGSQASGSQETFFANRLVTGKPEESFRNVHKDLMKLYRFGRYAVYIYTEALYRCTGMPIMADNMFLKDAASPRAGLCIAIGKPEWAKGRLSTEQWAILESEATALMQELRVEYPSVPFDPWIMESCFCAYKGFFARGRYLGYYIDRMASEILDMQSEDITSGVDWSVLWQFRREYLPWEYLGEMARPLRLKIENKWRYILRDTGHMIGLTPVVKRGGVL
jgi:hypothetical protein